MPNNPKSRLIKSEEKCLKVEEIQNPDWMFRTARWNTGKCEVCAYPIKSTEKYYGKVNNTDKRRHVKCYQALRQQRKEVLGEVVERIEKLNKINVTHQCSIKNCNSLHEVLGLSEAVPIIKKHA